MAEQGVEARRREILTAALALADERGLDALSMRAVAARVGVTPMALYPHVGNKDALLDGLVDLLLAELLPAAGTAGQWHVRLRAIAHAGRALAHRHRTTYLLLLARPAVTPDAVRLVDAIYGALLDAGVPEAQVPRLERLVSTFVLGFSLGEVAGRFPPADPRRHDRAEAAGGAAPAHQELSAVLAQPADWDAEFDAGLDDLMHVITSHVPPAAPVHRQSGR
ncbi:TetR/AcrR family transcriptional regulator [Catellatospora sichuanensis]|uniref:TetR/AcrR family transcriptional regulator n=1 Tax=Catellatospora sichuanensis TaxID=1969805 RepID=UPI001182D527|nr:TetR/AcrR family transcriptional regulator [Catellatospora sichuanensis]